jgi:hypothetical protein
LTFSEIIFEEIKRGNKVSCHACHNDYKFQTIYCNKKIRLPRRKAQGTRDKAQERYKVQGPGAKQDARGKGLLNMELAWEDLL